MFATCNYMVVRDFPKEQKLFFLQDIIQPFVDSGFGKRFTLIGRKVTGSNVFSTRYIYSNYSFSGSWVDFLKEAFKDGLFWKENKFTDEMLDDYCNSIIEFLDGNVDSIRIMAMLLNRYKSSLISAYLLDHLDDKGMLCIPESDKSCTEEQTKEKARRTTESKADKQDDPYDPVVTPIPTPHQTVQIDFGNLFHSAINEYITRYPWFEKLEERFNEEVSKLRPIVVKVHNRPEVKVDGRQHAAFETAIKLAQIERQVFLSGPMGTGKTTLARQVAVGLSLPFAHISCTIGMSEAQLLGRINAHGEFMTTDFIRLYENGGVFLFDEVDAADANTMLVINSALANDYLSLPNRKEKQFAQRHKDFICFCAANTWGFGSNEYAGRNILDAAFLDRFVGSKIFVDYDKDLEAEISRDYPEAAKFLWKVRANVYKSRIRRAVSTRAVESCVRSLMYGDKLIDFAKRFFTGWTNEERDKAMQGVSFEKQTTEQEPDPIPV